MGNFKDKTQMRNSIIFLTFAYLLVSCNSQTQPQSTIDASDSSIATTEPVRFFPEKNSTQIFDTTISDKQIQITIKRTELDSYVVNEYEVDGKKQTDKYSDAEISVTIKRQSQILLDTVFIKEQFLKYTDKGFLDIAIIHNYWFDKVDKDKIVFFGIISKPETDWTFAFNHSFDLTNGKLSFAEHTDSEE